MVNEAKKQDYFLKRTSFLTITKTKKVDQSVNGGNYLFSNSGGQQLLREDSHYRDSTASSKPILTTRTLYAGHFCETNVYDTHSVTPFIQILCLVFTDGCGSINAFLNCLLNNGFHNWKKKWKRWFCHHLYNDDGERPKGIQIHSFLFRWGCYW